MQLELITAKRKLTKSIVLQMEYATFPTLVHAVAHNSVLGYAQLPKITYYIVKGVNDYYKIPKRAWKVSYIHPTGDYPEARKLYAGNVSKTFASSEDRDIYLENYKQLEHLGRLHIYL